MAFLRTMLRALQFPFKWLFSFLLVDLVVTFAAFLLCLLTSVGLIQILWSGEVPDFRIMFFGIFAHLPFGLGIDITTHLGLYIVLVVVGSLVLSNGLHLWRLGRRIKDWFLFRGEYEADREFEDGVEAIQVSMDRLNRRSAARRAAKSPWTR